MPDLLNLDRTLFRWFNEVLPNPFLDGLMPLAGSRDLLPVGCFLVAVLALKMGRYGLPAIVCLTLIISLGEGLILSPLKEWIGRPRPPHTLDAVRLLVGLGRSESMPSAHAANWFCTVTILGRFYRPSLWLTLPLACLISCSRVYTGVHYPTDILVGAILGAAYGWAGVVALNWLWIQITRRWFPATQAFLPTLLPPRTTSLPNPQPTPQSIS